MWHSTSKRLAFGLLAVLLAISALSAGDATADAVRADAAAAGDTKASERADELEPRHRQWLEFVAPLITEEERDYFLSMREGFRRDAFIDQFWKVRDPDPRTSRNELKDRWMSRVKQALAAFGGLEDGRSLMLLLNGPPGRFVLPNGRELSRCYHRQKEIEIWFYGGSERTSRSFLVIFFRPTHNAFYRAWLADEALNAAGRSRLPTTRAADFCDSDLLGRAVRDIANDLSFRGFLRDLLSPPEPSSREWVATFASLTTELPQDVETFGVEFSVDFPGRNQNRTAVQGILSVPPEAAGALKVDGQKQHLFLLTGEVVRDGKLFENFRYRFEIPVSGQIAGEIPLVFQRFLRPGQVELLLKVEDLYGQRYAHLRRRLDIPYVFGLSSLRPVPESGVFRLLVEANEAAERGQKTLRIVPPSRDNIHIGMVRFDTVTVGDFEKVAFYLNDKPLLTKRRPPFSVELNLGSTAASHRLRAVAFDAEGEEAASDEILVNQGGQRFRVRLTEPRRDRSYQESLSAVAQIEVPDGEELDRLEIFLKERRVATLYQPPFVQPLLLDDRGLSYVRAVAYLTDGNSTEDVVFINAPDYFEHVEVQYVELYTSVYDRHGRPMLGLPEEEFTVWEDGVEQKVRRFEYVEDLPIHAGILLDTSASMEKGLKAVAETALAFVQQAIRPKDRVAFISFNARPRVEVRFTNHVDEVSAALKGLKAQFSTALYDSLVFALHYFDGMKGQRALLLLSDGEDEASQFDLDGTLEVARRAGVTVYVIGLKEVSRDRSARKVLKRFAEETGGRAFFLEDLAELPGIYRSIQEELRSQYLLTYQSTSTKDSSEFRRIKVSVAQKGVEVRTMAGYYP